MTDFKSVADLYAWRHRTQRALAGQGGPVFAKAMTPIGGRRTNGFGLGAPDVRRQVLLTVWRKEDDFDAFAGAPSGQVLQLAGGRSWWGLFDVVAARGSHRGAQPLRAAPRARDGGPFAALTLGRCAPRTLLRFLREGNRLASFIGSADGVVAAVSAGNPLSGNSTLSLWRSEADMLSFAYGDPDGHLNAVRADPPILIEQLVARLRARRIEGLPGFDDVAGSPEASSARAPEHA